MFINNMYLDLLKITDKDKLIAGIINIFNQRKIDDYLLYISEGEECYYISTKSPDVKTIKKCSEFDWKRYALKQGDDFWHIDSLLYDIKIDDNIILKKNKYYFIYTNDNEKTLLFTHYAMSEFPKSMHEEMIKFVYLLDSLFSKFYMKKIEDIYKNIDKRMETLTEKIQTLQRLSGLLQSTFEIKRILDIISQYISDSLGFKVVLLSLYNEQKNAFVRSSQHGIDKDVFEKLKKQLVPYSTIQDLMVEKYRISKSFYINHKESGIQKISDLSYVIPYEKLDDYTNWHPEDILLIPLYSKEKKIIGIITVDKPVDYNIRIKEAIDLLESFGQTASLAIENTKLFNKMNGLISDLELINNISSNLTSYLDINSMLNFLVKEMRERFNYINVTVWLFDKNGELEIRASAGYVEDYLEECRVSIASGEGITGWVAENDVPVLVPDTSADPRYIGRNDLVLSEIAVPLKISNHVIGVLNVEKEGLNSLDRNDLRIISIMCSHLSTAIDNTFKYEETEKLAVTDGMTGMYNYRYFINRLKEELSRAKKLNIPLSIIMLDIDFFKDINDTYGHIVGDKIIKELAELLRSIVRKGDIVTRYGGDEFFIILPGSSKQFTIKLANRIMKSVSSFKFTKKIVLTLSLGTVTYPEDASTMDSLLRWVDDALYSAKRKGRNRVEGRK